MAAPLKNLYSQKFYETISSVFTEVIPGFNKKSFLQKIHTAAFEDMELKQRMRHTSVVLHDFLPADYKQTIRLIKKAIDKFVEMEISADSFAYIFLADYIEVYGVDDYATSINGIEKVTQFISCEYAVRPFLLQYFDEMMKQMLTWSTHKNRHVRRLASEGCRPRLPWAMAIPALKKDPSGILPILENLKNDPSEYVRRSVANNLNDIAKDHPAIVLDIAKKWKGQSKETDAIIKHGSRTLLKQGHNEMLKHYGLDSSNIVVSGFKILTTSVTIGESLEFAFTVNNTNTSEQTVRLEYAIFYRKQNGQPSKKVFKISEKIYPPNIKIPVHRRQKFVLITTRKFYEGTHRVAIIVNGEEKAGGKFELKMK